MDIKPDLSQLNKLIQAPTVAKPLHIQQIEKALNVSGFLKQVYSFIDDQNLNVPDDAQIVPLKRPPQFRKSKSIHINHVPNTTSPNRAKQWLPQHILLDKSDSESSDPDAGFVSNDEIEHLIKLQKTKQRLQSKPIPAAPCTQPSITNVTSTVSSNIVLTPTTISSKIKVAEKLGKLTTLNSSAVNCEVYLTPAKILDESMLTACQSFEHPDIASLAPIQQIADLESSTLLPTIEVKSERLPLTDSNQLNFSTAAPILPLLKKKPTQPDMLDHITYDPTLPDEILQGESNTGDNLISSFPSSTMTTQHQIQSTNHHSHPHHDHHRSDTIIYSQHLPDDIFDAEQDTNAVSAPLSSLASSLLHPASSDTNPSSNVQQLTLDSICQLISKETDLTKSALTVNGNITSNPIAPISPGARRQAKKSKPSRGEKTIEMLNAKRRKVWTSIARKDIPKAQKQKVNQKREMLISCRKMAVMCMRDRKQLVLATRQQRHCSDQPPATGHCKIDSTPSPDPIDSIYSDSHPLEVILTEDGVNVEPHADLFAIAPPPSSSDHILRPYASSSSTFASACASSPSLSSSSSSSTSSSAILVTSLIMPDSNRFDLASGRAS